jgi:hypothetical protein
MPLYFFDIHHNAASIDQVGEELPDHRAAWKEATSAAGHMLRDLHGSLTPGRDWHMVVNDEFRNPLYVLQISSKKPRF